MTPPLVQRLEASSLASRVCDVPGRAGTPLRAPPRTAGRCGRLLAGLILCGLAGAAPAGAEGAPQDGTAPGAPLASPAPLAPTGPSAPSLPYDPLGREAGLEGAVETEVLTTLEDFVPDPGVENGSSTEVLVGIDFPPDQTVVSEPTGAFLAGHAVALRREVRGLDVLFVLDTSRSTKRMSGIDVDGDGIVGRNPERGSLAAPDPGDSILAGEVAAARRILSGLDPRGARVGLVTFAGEPARQSRGFFRGAPRISAITAEPLTHDHERVERAIEDALRLGPSGMTDLAAGVDHATAELVGYGGFSRFDPTSEKVVIFLTDGQPSLPYDPVLEDENLRALLQAAERAARAGVRIHSLAIGPEALAQPKAAIELAARTDGKFNAVLDPRQLEEVIRNSVEVGSVRQLTVRNLSSDARAEQVLANADGTWSALVPLAAGLNRIEVVGRASDGTEARAEVTLQFAPGAPALVPPRELVGARNRLLEQRLVDVMRDRVRAESERIENTRRQLELEIEQERARSRGRSPAERKELELELDQARRLPRDPSL